MKLITERVEDVQFLAEEKNGKKQLFIEGIFLQSDLINKNKRYYPKQIMEKEVNRYIKESIDRNNAYGELGHPTGPTINPDRISHRIVSLKEDGANYIGRAQISSTPMGDIVRGLMEDGGQLAVSSRGVGSLKQVGAAMHVQEDFMLSTAADIVINPSAPSAFVNGILESREYFYSNIDERIIEEVKRDLDKARLTEEQILRGWGKLLKAVI